MEKNNLKSEYELIVIGGSAGSLEVIIKMLQVLKTNKFAVIIIVHRKGSAESSLTDLLGLKAVLRVKEAEEKELIEPGNVYIAPADYHLLIEKNHSMSLDYSEKVNFSRPSIDVTFECAAGVYGPKVIGILLSGGNDDGVNGLKAIKKAGGFCIVQDPETAGVRFMPQHALNEVKIDKLLVPDAIAPFLNSY